MESKNIEIIEVGNRMEITKGCGEGHGEMGRCSCKMNDF
jgi:hypothetical protein